jgi:hypothetical protein
MEKPEGKSRLKDVSLDGEIILKYILKSGVCGYVLDSAGSE